MPKPKQKAQDQKLPAIGHADVTHSASKQDQFLYAITHDMKAGLRALTELPVWVEDDLDEHDPIAVP